MKQVVMKCRLFIFTAQYLAANLCLSGAVVVVSAIISQVHYHPVESKISLIHKIIIIILKKLTLWCDPDPPEEEEKVEEEVEEDDESVVNMRTDDLRKIERSIFSIKRNVVQPEINDGFTETIQVKDKTLLHIPDELKSKLEKPKKKKNKPKPKPKPKLYDAYNWDTIAKVWDRFFFILGAVAISLFHLAFVNILRLH